MIRTYTSPAALLGLLTSLSACAAQQDSPFAPNTPLSVEIAGQTLTLENRDNLCTLVKPDRSAESLELSWPCRFGIDDHGEARVEHFNEAPIVLVQTLKIDPARFPRCESRYRAIRYFKGQLEISVIDGGASCNTGPTDQKFFTALFRW